MNKIQKAKKRKVRIRAKLVGTSKRPRLSVYRSNKAVYAQLIDDEQGKTLLGLSQKHVENQEGSQTVVAKALGQLLAQKAKEIKITAVIFDKGSYMYHGIVKAVADGAREGGLQV
jgi:large subunit ribosomal protein L18